MINRNRIDNMLTIAVVAAVVATLGSYLGQFAWWLDLIANFRFHLTVGAALLLVVAVLGRRRFLVVLCLTLTIANGVALTPYFAVAEAGPTSLKVVSYNVHWENLRTKAGVAFLRGQDADVITLTEITPQWQDALRVLHASYPYRYLGPPCKCTGELPHWQAIFSKKPAFDHGVLRLSTATRSYAVWARFPGDGGDTTIFSVHLSKPFFALDGDQRIEIGELAQFVRKIPGRAVVAGDFNMTPFSSIFQRLTEGAGVRRADGGLNSTWPAVLAPFAIPIDHVLVNAKVWRAFTATGPRLNSDHLPLITQISTR